MPRKRAQTGSKQVAEAVEEFKQLTMIRYEMAKDVFDHQDEDTQEVLQRIVDRLRLSATGYITVSVNPPHSAVVPVKIEQQYVDFNLLFIATEILKDLATFDVRVASFEFPPSLCASCGAEITGQARKRKRVRA